MAQPGSPMSFWSCYRYARAIGMPRRNALLFAWRYR
jgi:hypothetical protein